MLTFDLLSVPFLQLFCNWNSGATTKQSAATVKTREGNRVTSSVSITTLGQVVTERLPDTLTRLSLFGRWHDPIFSLAVPLRAGEEGSHSRKSLCRSPEEPPPGIGGAPLSSSPVLGGWFGRGCTKRVKRKKVT